MVGGVPHPRSGRGGGYPIQVWMVGGGGYPIPSQAGGVPHLRSPFPPDMGWGTPQAWDQVFPLGPGTRYPLGPGTGYPPGPGTG